MPCPRCEHCRDEVDRWERKTWGRASDILDCVARSTRHPRADLRAVGRGSAQVAIARQLACYLIREMTDLSFPAIASFVNRDHSTIVHARDLIANRIERSPAFAKYVAGIRRDIEAKLRGEKVAA